MYGVFLYSRRVTPQYHREEVGAFVINTVDSSPRIVVKFKKVFLGEPVWR